jgi:hypothetical protein
MTPQDLSIAISDLYANTVATGKVTPDHRQILKDAICSCGLKGEEQSAVDRLLWATARGRLSIED